MRVPQMLSKLCMDLANRHIMRIPSRASLLWSLALLILPLLPPQQALGLSHYWGKHPDKERLVIVFPDKIPPYTVKRSDNETITLTLPEGYWQSDSKPDAGNYHKASLLKNVRTTPGGLRIDLKTNEFGYIQFPLDDRGKLVIDIFPDPIGAKWKPGDQVAETPKPPSNATADRPEEEGVKEGSALEKLLQQREEKQQQPKPAATPIPDVAEKPAQQPPAPKEPEPRPQARPEAAPAPLPKPAAAESAPASGTSPAPSIPVAKPEPKAPAPAAQKAPAQGQGEAKAPEPAEHGNAQRQNRFFSVPYSYRAPISRQGPEEEQPSQNRPLPQPDMNSPKTPAPPVLPQDSDNSETMSQDASPLAANALESKSLRESSGLLAGTPFGIAVAHAEEGGSIRQPINPGPPPEDIDGQPPGAASPPSRSDAPAQLQPQTQLQTQDDGSFTMRATMAPKDQTIPTPVQRIQSTPSPTRTQGPVEVTSPDARNASPDGASDISGTQPDAAPDAQPQAAEQQTAPPDQSGETSEPIVPQTPEQAAEAPQQEQPDVQAMGQGAGQPAEQSQGPSTDQNEQSKDAEAKPKEPSSEELLRMQKQMAEEGNPEEQGPTFEETFMSGRAALANEDYDVALEAFTGLKQHINLPEEMKEDVLYSYAEAMYAVHRKNLRENYSKIVEAYTEAMNHNLKSPQVPEALFKLGLMNLKVDNPLQAEAFFNILKKQYPDDDRVPLTHYYWGEYYFDHGKFQKAADEFQFIVQKFPDNRFVREASVGLARSLVKLGYEEQAQEIVDYIDKRWPRYYVQYPPLLKLFGDVNFKVGAIDKAKLHYWTYYNLDPDDEEADIVLARLGDIYLQLGDSTTAKEVYEMAVKKFPEREGGLIAQMRLAEQGVYDTPSIDDMFSVFDRPYDLKPSEVYTMIVDKYPNSDIAPLAQVKLGMWQLWNKDYRNALKSTQTFRDKFPGSKLMDSAKAVAMQSYDNLVAQDMREENYRSIKNLWDSNPILQAQEDQLTPEARIGLATSFWKLGDPEKGRRMLDPFFMSPAMPKQSENALMLAMSICLDNRDWACLTDLAERTELWDISPVVREKMNYNLALAYENLDQPEKSAPLWEELAKREDIDPKQMAYINYFLANEAKNNDEFKRAYDLAQNSLSFFLEQREDIEKIKDLLAMLMDITDKTQRTRESLKWAIEYARFINRNDPEWPALRYRMAQLYKQLADVEKWRAILEELEKDMPHTLYGRMASSELKTHKLEKSASQFTPTGRM